MKSDKKTIVIIDNYLHQNEIVKNLFENMGFKVVSFSSFSEASDFLNVHTPELIISDLIGHENISGVEFYINEVMNRNLNFALWTGCLTLKDEGTVKDFGLFLEGLPKDYRVTFDPKKALNQGEVELIIQDYKRNSIRTFSAFSKPGDPRRILEHFKLNANNLVILYFGALIEAVRLGVK